MKLGMGLEKQFRSQGIGSALLKTAIEWAKTHEAVSWIDLSTFSKNIAARSMYEKFGFVETHIIEDALRVDNESIDDVQMVLRLK
jgi:putative acetyltransferase